MLSAITSFFNPAGYQSKLTNYRTFRKHMRLPLITVELSFTGRFVLQAGDADVLVQLSGGDILWQKERLLNVALRHLPVDCDFVAWLDCDVIFAEHDWPARACAALGEFRLVQPFSERCNLAQHAHQGSSEWGPVESAVPGLGHEFATSRPELRAEAPPYPSAGLAWVARRSLLEKHQLYDARVIGGGDSSIACAAIGRFDQCRESLRLNAREEKHYRAWAEPFFADVGGRIGYVDGRAFHLWHGDFRDRGYQERLAGFARLDFDPFSDVALRHDGCWRWSSEKPELHEYVKSYFFARNEDSLSSSSPITTTLQAIKG